MPETIFDCSVISNYALAEALGILDGLFRDRAFMTDFVAAEVLRGIQAGHARLEVVPRAARAGWLRDTGLKAGKEKRFFEPLSRALGLGEASSIAAAEIRGYVFASDDRVARAEAAALDGPLTGMLGILVKAVRAGACDLRAADGHLARMIEAGLFSPVRSIRELISPKKG